MKSDIIPEQYVMDVYIVLVPGFSLLSLGAIVEPLKSLNSLLPEPGVRLHLTSIAEPDAESASSVTVHCPVSIKKCLKAITGSERPVAVFLCCGLRTPYKSQRDIQNLLKTAHRSGVALYGTGCAAWKMADAGILHNSSSTVHWTTLAAFTERHREIDTRDALFVSENQITSTPGEAAALDMTIAFIEAHFSARQAREVCNHLLISFPRPGDLNQPRSPGDHLQNAPSTLRDMVALMDQHLEHPLTIREIAATVGLSIRQTERLFARYLSTSPKQYYLKQRLKHSRQLIELTSMSILEISIAAGFSSRRDFTRYYRQEFGFPPAHTRRTP